MATIEAGNNVIPVLIELWQKIYGSHGYYMDFQEDNKLLFISSALTKITLDELEKLMQVFFKRGIFSKQIYEKYQILTSDSIQERYVESCIISKRQNTIIYSEYLCYEIMPEDACQFFYKCKNCGVVFRPKSGDCCVFCSYGSIKCPSKQREDSLQTLTDLLITN